MPFAIWDLTEDEEKFDQVAHLSGKEGLLNLFHKDTELLEEVKPPILNKRIRALSVDLELINKWLGHKKNPENKNPAFLIQNNGLKMNKEKKNIDLPYIYKVTGFSLSYEIGHGFVSYMLNLEIIGQLEIENKIVNINSEGSAIKKIDRNKNSQVITFGYFPIQKKDRFPKDQTPKLEISGKNRLKLYPKEAVSVRPDSVFLFYETMSFFKSKI